MRLGTTCVLLACLAALTACGADPDVVEAGSRSSANASTPTEPTATPSEKEQGQLLESGFGQDGEYVNGVALVKNTSDHGGQTVTVSFNFLDATGSILATVSQVDSFNFPGQTVAIQGFTGLDDRQAKVASVEPTLLVEDEGTFEETEVDFGTAEAKLVKSYGAWTAKVPVKNPTAAALKSPAVRVACRDDAGKIDGGGFTFPDLVAPNGEVVADVSLTVSGDPASCLAYIGGPIF